MLLVKLSQVIAFKYIFLLSFFSLVILSLIAVSILEASGLLKQIFLPLKKIKPKYVTLIVMFVGIISTIIGDYSYEILLQGACNVIEHTGLFIQYVKPIEINVTSVYLSIMMWHIEKKCILC